MAKPDITLRRKLREEKQEGKNGLKFVIDGAKVKCDLCTVPYGDLKANYNTPSIQDKRVVTIVEKDIMSLIFKGNCKKSFMNSSPCASVMKLGEWKNPGTVYFQDELAVLLRSTIKCEYGGVDIKIWDCGQRNEINNLDTTGLSVPDFTPNFDIKFELDTTEDTVVPFGILDFESKQENQFFKFKYTLEKNNLDAFYFDIISEDGELLYSFNCLKPAIIDNESKDPLFKIEKTSHIPMVSALQSIGNPDLEPVDYTALGTYIISWDGFDNDAIYDSTRFNNKELKARITGIKDGIPKKIVVDFSTKYNQVKWTDVKIDKNTKRIDVTLRVNLTDGGTEGLNCWKNTRDFNPPHTKSEICDWDKISEEALEYYKQSPVKYRTKSFEELRDLATEGVNKHWSRNSSNIGKGVNISNELFEVFIVSKADRSGLSAPKIIYQTNVEEGRSRNWEGSRILFYYEGYLYYNYWKKYPDSMLYINKGWEYKSDDIEDYKMVSAHEIGHEILLAYGGHIYSKTHEGTSHWSIILQDPSSSATDIPNTGEIDLMKYYKNRYDITRTIIPEFDLLKLIWLTKLKIK
ncbi:PAAR-like protein [[Flexibacter] sp. ATCC 35103]|uniref:PAAR-like protein n=1 Tax=[Flexibacter] sp. ATCC 35103 TaxID=1937528 RepID=UPI0009C748E5|nr:PAAR-like protein [[Flexibacter] sp. ATCC 35103]OMQ10524.1 hypothetical protein BXU01_14725 [[Flexibacter] sp. ATCC 35103]